MPRSKKRKPDLRCVRPTKTYTLPEISDALDRTPATIRRWLFRGLPTLDDKRPALVDGQMLRNWLKAEWQARRSRCASDQLYCLKCRSPKQPAPGSVTIVSRNAKTLSITAICPSCDSRMNKVGARKRRQEIMETFSPFMREAQRLVGCGNPSVNHADHSAWHVPDMDGDNQLPDLDARNCHAEKP